MTRIAARGRAKYPRIIALDRQVDVIHGIILGLRRVMKTRLSSSGLDRIENQTDGVDTPLEPRYSEDRRRDVCLRDGTG